MDISQMSGPMQAFYLLAMFGGIFGLLYYFYLLLVKNPEDKEAEREKLRDERKKKKKWMSVKNLIRDEQPSYKFSHSEISPKFWKEFSDV